jgi:hypothetical protein
MEDLLEEIEEMVQLQPLQRRIE